ncbi:putative copper export protein [Mycobacterium sp. BK086]|uniref:zinc ribbon domain-containing protein n=1 Tax=Mycobacterium sp. BK086 TaxID=2512165 RepID=UPI0010F15F28|nr:zinc ribbon domain-containing protein [Mycobacterium sp. BK086]TDO17739.1 putative copper export protein [Mycobacterium sp. BK086]
MPILRSWLTSSLFPQLTEGSRNRFRVALLVFVAVLVAFAELRWQAPMIATAVCGLPLLFVIYLREIDARRTVGLRGVVVSGLLGLGLAVGWALIAGPIVARAYDVALGAQADVGQVLLFGVAVPVSEALLMMVPAVVVRLTDRSPRDPLGGFAIGAFGATVFTGAATAILLVPQLAMGVTAPDRSVGSLLVEALVEGVAWPLVGVATGGIIGIALWFTKPAKASRASAALLLVLLVVTAMGVVDVIAMPSAWYGVLHLLIAAAAMVVLRFVLAAVTRRRTPEEARATGQSSYPRVLGWLAAGLSVAVVVGVVVSARITPAPEVFACPPDCGRPPLGTPVETNPRFSGDDGAFSVAYPGNGSAYDVAFDPPGVNGVELTYTGGDTGTLTLFGEPARDRTARQVVAQIVDSRYPGATIDYEIPNASVGYQPGYGVVADVFPTSSSATYTPLRVIVMAAVKHDYALIAAAIGPYHRFGPDYGDGHPSGANLELAMDMGKYVNSFRWHGDRYGRPS